MGNIAPDCPGPASRAGVRGQGRTQPQPPLQLSHQRPKVLLPPPTGAVAERQGPRVKQGQQPAMHRGREPANCLAPAAAVEQQALHKARKDQLRQQGSRHPPHHALELALGPIVRHTSPASSSSPASSHTGPPGRPDA